MVTYSWAIGLGGVIVAILALACTDDQEAQIADQNEAASERVGTIPIFDLRLGDCFIDSLGFVDAPEGDLGEAGEVTLVACSDPAADIEVTRLFAVEREGAWPGVGYMDEEATGGCPGFEDEFDEYVTYLYPTEDSWEIGDRTITCLRALR